jgi:hypothetical protein
MASKCCIIRYPCAVRNCRLLPISRITVAGRSGFLTTYIDTDPRIAVPTHPFFMPNAGIRIEPNHRVTRAMTLRRFFVVILMQSAVRLRGLCVMPMRVCLVLRRTRDR